MTPEVAIGVIAQLLTLCGLVSIRMFLPTFLYFLLMRLALSYPDCALIPELVRQLAGNMPPELVSDIVLWILGILAALELAAMRNPDIKEFLIENKDLDRYVKLALSLFVSFRVMSATQALEVGKLIGGDAAVQIQTASFGGSLGIVLVTAAGGYVTWLCCRIRSAALEIIHTIDPEDDLRLQSLSNYLGEIALLVIFLLLLFLSTLLAALVLTAIVMLSGVFFQRLLAQYEQQHSHPCGACAADGKVTSVSDCALICPECGAEQPDVRQVGWFGLSGNAPLTETSPEEHAFRLLAAHRCRWCASPLDRAHVCPRCGRGQWMDGLPEYYVRQTDMRSRQLLLLALVFFLFPFGGLMLALIFFRPLAVRPLAVHLSAGERFLTGLKIMFLRLLILLPLLILSAIPVVGLLVLLPFIWRYRLVRAKFLQAIEPPVRPESN